MRKIIITIALAIGAGAYVQAQQDPMFTQYMFNTLSINPGYAGSADMLSVSLLSRHQWVNIEGAPTTQTFVAHTPIGNNNFAVGLSVVNDKIGPTKQLGFYGDFSYKLKVGEKNTLALGLKAGGNTLSNDFTSLKNIDINDKTFQSNTTSGFMPNVGFGLYFRAPKYYVGLSAPKLLENDLSDNSAVAAKENNHYFAIAGLIVDVNETIKFKPTILTKYVAGSPLSLDLTASFLFNDKLWLGAMYRLEDAVGGIVQYNITQQFRIGYAYDHTLSDLQTYAGGTHEIMLNYDFIFGKDKVKTPRFF